MRKVRLIQLTREKDGYLYQEAQHHTEIDDSLEGEFLETSDIHGLTVITKPIAMKGRVGGSAV